MIVNEWLASSTRLLQTAGIDSARLDCLILLEDAIGKDRAWLLAHPEYRLLLDIVDGLDKKVVQRVKHIPLAYIRGHVEFYGRNFLVNAHVLVPRPESESIIELLKSSGSLKGLPGKPVIIDIGTGSGALAISAKLELPQAVVWATDIDENCLTLARQNARALGADVRFVKADLLQLKAGVLELESEAASKPEAIPAPDIILANLPYVPDDYAINPAAAHEPALALFGGPDGLDMYRQLFEQCAGLTSHLTAPPVLIITEALPSQHHQLATLAREHGYSQYRKDGFVQTFVS